MVEKLKQVELLMDAALKLCDRGHALNDSADELRKKYCEVNVAVELRSISQAALPSDTDECLIQAKVRQVAVALEEEVQVGLAEKGILAAIARNLAGQQAALKVADPHAVCRLACPFGHERVKHRRLSNCQKVRRGSAPDGPNREANESQVGP
jgi:hypothetical protein